MEFSFRGPPQFWARIAKMAEDAQAGATVYCGNTTEEDPTATSDWRITFVGDPEGDGIGLLCIPDDDPDDVTPWMELSDRVAENS